MSDREPAQEAYSLDEFSPESLSSCAVLAWELLRRDRVAPPDVKALIAAAEGAAFEQRLGSIIRPFDAMIEAEKDRSRWDRLVAEQIDKTSEPREREVIFAFLFDLAAIATIDPAEAAFLDQLRRAWNVVDR